MKIICLCKLLIHNFFISFYENLWDIAMRWIGLSKAFVREGQTSGDVIMLEIPVRCG